MDADKDLTFAAELQPYDWAGTQEDSLVLEPEERNHTYAVIGAGFEVLNSLGCGLRERTYENAMVVEFQYRGIPFEQQRRYDVFHRSIVVGEYIPDLVAFNKVIVEAKVIECITDGEMGQVLNYLKITGLQLGLILNFKKPQLEWKRVVRSSA